MNIELEQGQSANPNECGSCQYFGGRGNKDLYGVCNFLLPPWVMTIFKTSDEGFEVNPRTVSDRSTCSFYRPKLTPGGDPVLFSQRRFWLAGDPK